MTSSVSADATFNSAEGEQFLDCSNVHNVLCPEPTDFWETEELGTTPTVDVDSTAAVTTSNTWDSAFETSEDLQVFSSSTATPVRDPFPQPGHSGVSLASISTSAPSRSQSSSPSLTVTEATATAAPSLASVDNAEVTSAKANRSGLSSGAVVGVAIGSLIAGFAFAFLAAFLLFKRRNQRHRQSNISKIDYASYGDSTAGFDMMQQKSVIGGGFVGRNSPYVQVSQTPMPAPSPLPVAAPVQAQKSESENVAAFLPPAARDGDVHGRVTALFEQIHQHVEMYYRDVHASITVSMEPELARLGAEGMNMAELLRECSSPTAVLKHALVAYVLAITAPSKDGDEETIFPEQLSNVRFQDSQVAESDPDFKAATSLHRRLTVYLYNATSGTSTPHRSWLAQSNIREAAEHFSLTFFPWANPTSSDQDKDEDVAHIISQALEVRIWLFGQAAEYEFEWEGTGRRGVLISPGLLRHTDGGEMRVVEGVVVGV